MILPQVVGFGYVQFRAQVAQQIFLDPDAQDALEFRIRPWAKRRGACSWRRGGRSCGVLELGGGILVLLSSGSRHGPAACRGAVFLFSEGIALAKQRGAYRGRKKALSPERVAELRRRAAAGEKKAQLAREFGISRETLYQYLRAG